jgi:hypothetical protein
MPVLDTSTVPYVPVPYLPKKDNCRYGTVLGRNLSTVHILPINSNKIADIWIKYLNFSMDNDEIFQMQLFPETIP